MEFGRTDQDLSRLDLSLPAEPGANARVLAAARALGPAPEPVVRVGLAGWSHPGFAGTLVPPGTPASRFLELHARAFTTNELNTTYYGVDAGRLERWAAATPESFRFCPKLPARITHELGLVGAEAETERFLEVVGVLGPRLGLVWGLLPPDAGPERLGAVTAFARAFGPRVPLALEVRHGAWFARTDAFERLAGALEESGVALVVTDTAGRRDAVHLRLTAPRTIVRLVGNRPHRSDERRLADWVERLADWRERGLVEAHLFLHQRSDPEAVDTARLWRTLYARRTGIDPLPHLPEPADVARVVQGSLFDRPPGPRALP